MVRARSVAFRCGRLNQFAPFDRQTKTASGIQSRQLAEVWEGATGVSAGFVLGSDVPVMNRLPDACWARRIAGGHWQIVFFLALFSFAEAAPEWQNELTSSAPGPFARLAPTVLDLEVTWNGTVNAGSIRMEFSPAGVKKPGLFVARSAVASHGAAAVLFPYHSSLWSELDPTTLRPRYFHAVETSQKEAIDTTVRHFPGHVESREVTRLFKTGKMLETTRSFPFTPAFDIFSALLHVRSQRLDPGDHVTLVIHPFDNPYLLRIKVQGREIHNGRKAIRLAVGLQKIDRNTLQLLPYKKLKRDANLWLSDDADRIPIELRAAALIGDVRATLVTQSSPN